MHAVNKKAIFRLKGKWEGMFVFIWNTIKLWGNFFEVMSPSPHIIKDLWIEAGFGKELLFHVFFLALFILFHASATYFLFNFPRAVKDKTWIRALRATETCTWVMASKVKVSRWRRLLKVLLDTCEKCSSRGDKSTLLLLVIINLGHWPLKRTLLPNIGC